MDVSWGWSYNKLVTVGDSHITPGSSRLDGHLQGVGLDPWFANQDPELFRCVQLPFEKVQHSITAEDHQPTPDSCVISMVVGQVKVDNDPVMGFHQLFHLKNVNSKWICTNDMFRLSLHNFGSSFIAHPPDSGSPSSGWWVLFITPPVVLQVLDYSFPAALPCVLEELPIRAQDLQLQHPLVAPEDLHRAAPHSNSHEALRESEAPLQSRGIAI
ncbi:NTF2 factor, partial [Polypterus senegalus]